MSAFTPLPVADDPFSLPYDQFLEYVWVPVGREEELIVRLGI